MTVHVSDYRFSTQWVSWAVFSVKNKTVYVPLLPINDIFNTVKTLCGYDVWSKGTLLYTCMLDEDGDGRIHSTVYFEMFAFGRGKFDGFVCCHNVHFGSAIYCIAKPSSHETVINDCLSGIGNWFNMCVYTHKRNWNKVKKKKTLGYYFSYLNFMFHRALVLYTMLRDYSQTSVTTVMCVCVEIQDKFNKL